MAQDMLAVSAIQMYRLLAEAHGCQVAEGLIQEIQRFLDWRGEKRLPAWPAACRDRSKERPDLASCGRTR